MAYRKLKGDHLFDGQRLWKDNRVLVTDDKGKKIDIIATEDAGDDVLYQPGLITPGFVNAHCHLELSHLKNAVTPHTSLVPFLLDVVNKREFPEEKIHAAILEAMREMEEDGIIAVGDICNTDHTAAYKTSGPIQWRNFIEVLSFTDAKAPERIAHYLSILRNFEKAGAGPSSLCSTCPIQHQRGQFQNDQ